MRPACLLLTTLAAPLVHAQSSPNLADYLQRHPVDSKGPVMAVEPDRVKPDGAGTSLGAFGRKAVTLGNATFIVPTVRVDIDDSVINKEPNMYEGLPSGIKLLYLMRSLTDAQWKKVSSQSGLGLGDLVGEQRLVFDSLLPKPFGWTAVKIGRNRSYTREMKRGTLTDRERQQVRLRLMETVDLGVSLANQPNATSNLGSHRYRGQEGDWLYQRDQSQDYRSTSTFGLRVSKEVPNQPKASQLDFTKIANPSMVTLPPKATVAELVAKAGAATGLEIMVDFRVGERTVVTGGGEIRAAHLLQGLALAVTGTYRKVGSAYELTSDLVGMGARKYRIATWQRSLEAEANRRAVAWMAEIAAQPGFERVTYDPSLGLSPEQAETISGAHQGGKMTEFAAASLPATLRALLNQWDVEYPTQPIRKDRVQLSPRYMGQFVLPNGTALRPELDAGFPFQFRRPTSPVRPGGITRQFSPSDVDDATGLTFYVATETPGSVESLLAPFRAYATQRIWVETHSSSVLKKAIEVAERSQIKIGLAILPWRATTRTPDTNIGGQHGDAVAPQLDGINRNSQFLKCEPIPDWMAPDDPGRRDAWKSYAELAKTPGLQGVLLLETQPYGYEKTREPWYSMIDPLGFAVLAHGYTPPARLAFLRAESIDPIDIGDEGYWTTPDLRQPFFLDDGLRGMPSLYDGSDDTNPKMGTILKKWREFLAARQLKATRELLDLLGTQPISMELRLANLNQVQQRPSYVVTWKPGQELPITSSDLQSEPLLPDMQRLTLLYTPAELAELASQRGQVWPYYGNARPGHPLNLILGFNSSDPARIAEVLAQWFKPKGTP